MIYDGSNLPFNTQFTVVNLQTGLPYRFKLKSKNKNGVSADSPISLFWACEKPSAIPPPTKIATTSSSVTLGWTEPESNGCPVKSFDILRDTGENDALSVSVDPESVNNRPSLREYTVGGLLKRGNTYRFKIRATNNAGSSDSIDILNVVLADEPNQPTDRPVSDASVTNESRIKVFFGPQSEAENGGAPILSYELQIDNGIGGNFTSLIGNPETSTETEFTVFENILPGGIYRFRYRSLNVNGWSAWSQISHIKAATLP